MERYGEIYIIRCLSTGKLYIGQTTQDLKTRWYGHLRTSRDGSGHAFARALKKHGKSDFEIRPFVTCFTKDDLDEMECRLIKEYDTLSPKGYNIQEGGFGHKCSDQTKLKISKANAGRVFSDDHREKLSKSHKGKSHSSEAKKKIGEASLGRKHTAATLRKISRAKKGKKRSAETIAKLSKAQKGKKLSEGHKKAIFDSNIKPILDQNGILYISIKEASMKLGIPHCGISRVLHGFQRHTHGFVFVFTEKES